ncbi:hypothetical protein [Ancylobacter polymorphus]|uniref:Uncharacterized protein n=1 Tax=Ancylobacter polymorphus TaxID=223390 RepID=A0ABU0B6B5_9HYPH|nr:hypothetical protein [Ancylobacter polymorphus]MDQ0301363.1 hypothetical protein [Ancylobacter polymorphus]
MSLVATVSRIAFAKALEGRTSAGAVLNAPKEPLDRLGEKPVIAVYTGAIKFDPRGRDLYGSTADQIIELVIQMILPPGNVVVEGMELTMNDAGAGFGMDLLWRQVVDALADPANTWADLYREIVRAYAGFTSAPVLVEVERNVPVPYREVQLNCRMIPEPSMGAPLSTVWQKIDAKLRTDPELVPVADALKVMIERPAGMPSWRITQARMGWSDAEIRASGLAPLDATETGEAPTLEGAIVEDGEADD